jgi:hypothetical protein
MSNDLLIVEGSKPILINSIHACKDWYEFSTKEINEELQAKEDYFSLIYTGLKNKCIEKTEELTYNLLDKMLERFGRVGVISLHRRKQRCRKNIVDNNYFELGTIRNQSMNNGLKENYRNKLLEKGIVFDDNVLFTGGTECANMHTRYNDPTFVAFETSGFDPSNNLVQIAQIEFNGINRKKDFPFHYDSVLTLAKCMEEYITLVS